MSDLLEDGMYVGTIKKAEIIESEYMINQYNPTGTCLNLWIDVPYEDGDDTKRLFKRLNKTETNKLLESYNKDKVSDLYECDPSFLLKKSVSLEVQQYTSKAGKVSNIAKDIVPFAKEKKGVKF